MTLSSKYSEYCANPNCGRFLATYTSRKRGLCAVCDITAYREEGEKGDSEELRERRMQKMIERRWKHD
jgi:hypothetical protein